MAEISLSKAVRSNLLSLQSTAQTMAKTQERLATGNKVNSALDNPTNFFTASALNSRASDMGNLLDSMSNGIKTIEAADNGLKSITKTVESMQSTLRQARQDKSFKTQSFSIDATTIGTATAKNLTFSGGAFGTVPGTIQLNTLSAGGSPTTLAGAGANFGTDFAGGNITINGTTAAIRGDQAAIATNMAGSAIGGGFVPFTGGVTIDGHTVALVAGTHSDGTLAAAKMQADLGAGYTVNYAANAFTIVKADGTDIQLTAETNAGDAAKLGLTVGATATDGTVAFDATALTVAADINAAIAGLADGSGGQIALSLASGADVTLAGDNTLLTAIGFGAGNRVSTNGAPASTAAVKTVDALVTEINNDANLNTRIRASNDNGKLRIENLSTEALTFGGVGSDGEIDGTVGTTSVGGNEVRKNLVKQFNELRDQLDKLADDASFNGINLLRGDKLKLTFNETGTSTIDIQARKTDGTATSINNTNLAIGVAVNADFDSDTTLDARLDKLADALGSLRSHASSFGSNLSIVQNREDFTKSMINTLETGAANLTLADTNEEAANLLALQTRQQLSSTALSMASQADQAVLRLFG